MSQTKGATVPLVGFGTSKLKGEECTRAVSAAIAAGCRHFDCAKVYGNERYVGVALRNAVESGAVTREELFVASKLWNDDHHDVVGACRRSLRALGLAYLDLYYVHWPASWVKGTIGLRDRGVRLEDDVWRDMESLVDAGLARRLGVSNFGPRRLRRLLRTARIAPVVNQLELHPRLAQRRLVDESPVRCVAWSPLAKYSDGLTRHRVVANIARIRGRSPSQILLRWNVQRGVAVIPRSSNPSHVAENLRVADFALTDQEMDDLYALDRRERIFPDLVGVFEDTPFFPYHVVGHFADLLSTVFWFFVPRVFNATAPQDSLWEIFLERELVGWNEYARATFSLALLLWIIL